MNTNLKICNDILISSFIDPQTYTMFSQHLSKSLDSRDQGNYIDTFTLDNNAYDGQSVLKVTSCWIRGTVEDVVNWLRLVDLFILRPHGCFLINQHINFIEVSDPVVVTLTTREGSLITRIHHYIRNIDKPTIVEKNIPLDTWLQLVNQLSGHDFNNVKYIGDSLQFYEPQRIEGYDIKFCDGDEDIRHCHYHYSSQFVIDEFINRLSVNIILKRLQYNKIIDNKLYL